ncbi:DUF2059 domain-containing protein [Microbulbifer halophilus]|uniref:DUF2059 domain-containing protein n=1 Tax=Microbulbifer halophilus TaxID=453963 RepID=A0ABW5EJT4_9GAMM|nr:DUF2059 domain-containing protein [Microbulbifer halophilus]MCW8127367.1 DUF2059 domain-containing protein [Microbulbifer halophilus]
MKKLLIAIAASLFCPLALANAPSDDSIHELMEVTQTKQLMDRAMAQLDGMMKSSMQQALAGQEVTDEDQKILDEMRGEMTNVMKAEFSWEKMAPAFTQVYKQSLTQSEVDGMLEFYQTDAGKALIAKMPNVMQQTMQLMQQKSAAMAPKIQEIQKQAMARIQENDQQ